MPLFILSNKGQLGNTLRWIVGCVDDEKAAANSDNSAATFRNRHTITARRSAAQHSAVRRTVGDYPALPSPALLCCSVLLLQRHFCQHCHGDKHGRRDETRNKKKTKKTTTNNSEKEPREEGNKRQPTNTDEEISQL